MSMDEARLLEEQQAEKDAAKRERKALRQAEMDSIMPPVGRAAQYSSMTEQERRARILAFM